MAGHSAVVNLLNKQSATYSAEACSWGWRLKRDWTFFNTLTCVGHNRLKVWFCLIHLRVKKSADVYEPNLPPIPPDHAWVAGASQRRKGRESIPTTPQSWSIAVTAALGLQWPLLQLFPWPMRVSSWLICTEGDPIASCHSLPQFLLPNLALWGMRWSSTVHRV